MSKKFFSLLFGDSIRVAPNKKIISANELGQLLEAEEVVEKAKQEAEKYRADVVAECEKIKEKAQNEGYQAGFQKWSDHLAKLENEISKVRMDMEKVLVPVALKAARKIVGREMELSENTIVDIVANTLKAVSQHKKITIYVNKKDLDPLEKSRNRLKDIFESLEVLSLRERSDIAPGGCIIETEGGIINAQLENQWSALEKAFSGMIKAKDKSTTAEPEKQEETKDIPQDEH